jgi:hypothetical protein
MGASELEREDPRLITPEEELGKFPEIDSK